MRPDIKAALEKNKEVNKFYFTFGFKRMIKRVGKYIKPDETVKYLRNVNVKMNQYGELEPNSFSIKGKTPAVVVVTNKRVLIYYSIFPKEKLDQIPVGEIKSYDFSKDMISSKLRITSLTKTIDIDLTCSSDEIKLLNDVLEEVTAKAQLAIKNENSIDTTKALRELAGLRDDGIITEEEFEQKKSELLAKI